MKPGRHDEVWNTLSLEDKIEDLRKDIVNLFSIVENLNHQDHVFVDAMHVVHEKLDHVVKEAHAPH